MSKGKKIKLKWQVAPAPTGRYRSFEKRGWPSADYETGQPAITLYCDTGYSASAAKSGEHGEITVAIAVWREREGLSPTFDWRRLKARFSTLQAAKEAAELFIGRNPGVMPPELQPGEAA